MIVAYDPNKLWEMLKRVSESALPFFAPGGTSLVRELAAKMLFVPRRADVTQSSVLQWMRYLPSYTTL